VAKRSILDWLGCAFAGSMGEAAVIAGRYVTSQGARQEATIIGSGVRVPAGAAAWVNGISGHFLDFDDSGAHPSSYLVPTVLALGERLEAPGVRVLNAWVSGYEVTARLRRALDLDRAFHSTSVFGAIASSVAACTLLDASRDRIQAALGIAASQAGGLMRNFGTFTKSSHPGNAARSGIEAGDLALLGFTAAPDVLEGRYGYFDCFGSDRSDPKLLVDLVDHVSMTEIDPPVIKAWPTCTGTQRGLTTLEQVRRDQEFDPRRIVSVEVVTARSPWTGPTFYHPDEVRTGLQGKFSLEYTISAMLLDGVVDHGSFEDERAMRPDIRDLMRKIRWVAEEEARLHGTRTGSSVDRDRIRISMDDGSVIEARIGPRRTLTGGDVVDKYEANMEYAGYESISVGLRKLVESLETLDSIKELMEPVGIAGRGTT